ncbi:hypothetical protein Pan153_60180 [Gimesia panareensis]|uniref:Uncharacterized protein n=1 Tax=Gimesia panareensis TaxID=2527978 RepID=A0A517QFM7_9PLAN|nr:hypothetical protein Enr10x_57510 [Gimesia panareensis]QDU53446.1 hypothetical protein Pan110_58380 [Gimesia panareensis]QDV21330.1 hypothetical protein Pan153_60180 [Gimesia panareensis]
MLNLESEQMEPNETEVVCPACERKIEFNYGMNETGGLTSMEFQSRRLGCSIECPHCSHVFVYKVEPDDN